MSGRGHQVLAWFVLGVCAACLLAILVVAAGTAYSIDVGESPMLAVALSFAVVGAIVAAGAPDNAIGWLLLLIGTGLALFGVSTALVDLETARPGSIPAASVIAWLSGGFGFVWLLTIAVLLRRFPSGALPSPRWRWVNVAVIGAYLAWSSMLFAPGPLDQQPAFENPFGIPGFGPAASLLQAVGVLLFFVLLLVAFASVVVRFRRAEGVERLQIKWVALAVVTTVACWIVAFVTSYDDSQ